MARLVEQGTVVATQMGRNQVHELDREHRAAPVAAVLAGLRDLIPRCTGNALQVVDMTDDCW